MFEQTEVKTLFKPQKWSNIALYWLIISACFFFTNYSFISISLFSLSRYKLLRYLIRGSLLLPDSIQCREDTRFPWMLLRITYKKSKSYNKLFLTSSYWDVLIPHGTHNSCLQWVSKPRFIELQMCSWWSLDRRHWQIHRAVITQPGALTVCISVKELAPLTSLGT